jgi:hypothetical protein
VAKPKTEKTKDKAAAPKAAAAASAPAPADATPAKDGKAKALDGVVETPGVPDDKPYDPSAWMHERVARRIMEFEKNLGPDHEIGGRFVEGPTSEALHITNVASWGPDMILFMGELPDGRTFELIQHYSQVSVLLVAMKKLNDEPRRIGFELIKTVREQDHVWEDPVS